MTRFTRLAAILGLVLLAPAAHAGDAADRPAKKRSAKQRKADEAAQAEAAAKAEAEATAAEDAAADAEPAMDPEFAALLDALEPEIRAKVDAMSDDELALLLEKMGAGEPLTPEQQTIAEAFARAFGKRFDATLGWQHGDVTIENGMATLHLGDELRFLGPTDAAKVLEEAWGNPPDPTVLGMIVPADTSPLDPERGWGVVVTFSADGYVEDDDAEDLDYDELLGEMKKGTEEANPERQRQGYPAMHLVGWAEPPRYDAATHRLYWAQELSTDDSALNSLNYAIRVLGRKGVLELNAVAPMPMLAEVRPAMEQVLERVEFEVGHRYEDFDPDVDTVAAYGIGGLIAGKMLVKAGFFAAALKLLVAAKKFLIIGALAVGAGIKAWFSRRKSE